MNLPSEISEDIEEICRNIESQKGVYTALITLGVHKILNPSQDIRYHQDNMEGGFSARGIDTKFITPTLKEKGLPSMSESAWLTRSLEQPYPYLKSYEGKIKKVKREFLEAVDFFEKQPSQVENVLIRILQEAIKIRENNQVNIQPIQNPEKLTLSDIMAVLEKLLEGDYSVAGVSKFPVIVFYSLYEVLVSEVERYKGKHLGDLASHTSPDSRSQSSGDIEVFDQDLVFEAVEIKFGIEISTHLVNRAIEKIALHNPKRYYILSTKDIVPDDYNDIMRKVDEVKQEHGCQIVINGILPTIKYYLRLLEKMEDFIERLSHNISNDHELKTEHKKRWRDLALSLNFETS